MLDKFRNFVFGVSVNPVGKLGVILTTSSFIIFIFLEIARILDILTNAYIGLITYLLFPSLFIIGLLLIPIAWRQYKRRSGKSTEELLNERFAQSGTETSRYGSRLFQTVAGLTIINMLFMAGAAFQMMHFMDQPRFCGTACHSVMNPEWTTYQVSPHARVKCVSCHVGEGAKAAFDAKLNGIWQMISVTFNLYEKPIPTPVKNLRPARETCEKCHWPEKFYGSLMKIIVHYDNDEQSTPKYSTLSLKIDTRRTGGKSGIHWHVARENEVRYSSVDDKRIDMVWVEVRQPDGTYRKFENMELAKSASFQSSDVRILDCVDCHNRATHIYQEPDVAVDEKIQSGVIDHSLPYIKREALGALTDSYIEKAQAMEGIRYSIDGFYSRQYGDIYKANISRIESTVTALQDIYNRNIHPEMNITWGSYPSHIGHRSAQGCFRCHNSNLVDKDGNSITIDCTACHSILADEESEPFKYLMPPDSTERNYQMHEYLRDEFLKSRGYYTGSKIIPE
jgi:hypothetical protein